MSALPAGSRLDKLTSQINTGTLTTPSAVSQMNTLSTSSPVSATQINNLPIPSPVSLNAAQSNTSATPSTISTAQLNTLPIPSLVNTVQVTSTPSTVSASQMNNGTLSIPSATQVITLSSPSSVNAAVQMNTLPTPCPVSTVQLNTTATPSQVNSSQINNLAAPIPGNVVHLLPQKQFVNAEKLKKCLLQVISSASLENSAKKKPVFILPSNSSCPSTSQNIPIKVHKPDSKQCNDSSSILPVLNDDHLKRAQVESQNSHNVANPNFVNIPEKMPVEGNGLDLKPCIISAVKIKQEPKCSSSCDNSTCCSTPISPTSIASTSDISQGAESQGMAGSNGTVRENNDNKSTVSIGSCLMCGGDCDCCGRSDDEDEDVKPFLPPPPMSSVEVDSLFAKLMEQDKETPVEPASVINTKMFLHQKQALNWMINKENCNDLGPFWKEQGKGEWFNEGTKSYTHERPTCIKGGILADDMGLGKTLTIIALIFTNHLNGKPMFMKKENTSKKRKASQPDADEPKVKKLSLDSTLQDETDEVVVVKKEAKNHIKKAGAIKKRKEEMMTKKRLLEDKKGKDPGAMFRKLFLPTFLKKKGKKENKIKKEKPESSPVQKPTSINAAQPSTSKASSEINMIDDDDDSTDDLRLTDILQVAAPNSPMRPSKLLTANPVPTGAAKATLIICPLSVLSNWTDQICTHVNPAVNLRVYMYYGAQRIKDLKYLSGQDIVLTTYPTIANDFRSKFSPLHKIKWLRIILDEGHTIRNKGTVQSKSVLELEAERRWAVTGTPIQNRIDDLWTILLYLRLEPFSDKNWWKTLIAKQHKRGSDLADFRLNTLIKYVSIRRLKDEKVDNVKLVELPPKQVVIQDIELSAEERKRYDMLQLNGQTIIRRYIRHNNVLAHYAHCFAILMRLRQMCLHPRLCKAALKQVQQALDNVQDVADDADDLDDDDSRAQLIKTLMDAISAGDSEECAVCLESLNDPVITPCAHVFCCACITDVLNSEGLAPRCPMCRAPVDETDLLRVPEEQRNKNDKATIDVDDEGDQDVGSAKINALISSLEAIRDKDPSTKSVVVSQFISFLDIVEEYLEKHGFEYLRLDGSMRLEERLKALEDFNEHGSGVSVFLLSMSAGGTGLNLTAATRVFLMDPAWNPAVEEQCFDRCHRMGQTKEVIITKYIVMDSVEERMLTLQEEKRQLMSQAFGAKAQSAEDRNRARVRDIAHLIGLRPAQRGPNILAQ